MHPTKPLEELSSDDEEPFSSSLDELYSDDEDLLSLESGVFPFMDDDEELSGFSLEELLLVEDDEEFSFGSLEEFSVSSDEEEKSSFELEDSFFTDDDEDFPFVILEELSFSKDDEELIFIEDDRGLFLVVLEDESFDEEDRVSLEESSEEGSSGLKLPLELSPPHEMNKKTKKVNINLIFIVIFLLSFSSRITNVYDNIFYVTAVGSRNRQCPGRFIRTSTFKRRIFVF